MYSFHLLATWHHGNSARATSDQERLRGEIPDPRCEDEQGTGCCQGDLWHAGTDEERTWQDSNSQEHARRDWRSEVGPGVEGQDQCPDVELQASWTPVCILCFDSTSIQDHIFNLENFPVTFF